MSTHAQVVLRIIITLSRRVRVLVCAARIDRIAKTRLDEESGPIVLVFANEIGVRS